MFRLLTLFLLIPFQTIFGALVFIHVPHCGGMSIARTFKTLFKPEHVYPHIRGNGINGKKWELREPINSHIQYVHGHFGFVHFKELLKQKEKHTFVMNLRHPVAREITRYRRHVKRNLRFGYNAHFLCNALADDPTLSDEEKLISAKKNIAKIDYIINFDDISNSFDKTVRRCLPHLKRYPKLPHYNKTPKLPVPDEVIKGIQKGQAVDIELYNYIKKNYAHKIVH